MDPRWLIYLPPTISPGETSNLPGILEHPAEVFQQFARDGVERVICQEKHMGSRGIVIVGRTPEVMEARFGLPAPHAGICYSRTGRKFFPEKLEAEFLERARDAVGRAGLWEELETEWLLLDCEIMPWSLKAEGLLARTYAPVGAAAVNTLSRAGELIAQARERGLEVDELARSVQTRLAAVRAYREAYRKYCWETDSLEGVRVAPFLALAGERGVHELDHDWQLSIGEKLAEADPDFFQATNHLIVELDDGQRAAQAIRWWERMTEAGGEGMVVKPLDLIPRGNRDGIQPAVKVRGPEYLRIIYGPEYDLPGNMVMALESEPLDPRL